MLEFKMNERILELAVQAGVTGYFAAGTEYATPIPLTPELQKFAELIVKECARAVDKVYEDAEPDHGCYDWATWAEGADVLKHFGVE
jgi:hypothetical protein